MPLRPVQFIAIISIALCMVPAAAHFFELPGKLALSPSEYLAVQRIYTAWAWFGIVFAVALVATLVHAVLARGDEFTRVLSLISFGTLTVAVGLFFMFIYPLNRATQNWLVMPEAFEAARRQWEYTHAVNAVLVFAALVTMVLATLRYQQLDSVPMPR